MYNQFFLYATVKVLDYKTNCMKMLINILSKHILVSSAQKTDYHDITEILLKVVLNTIYPTPPIPNNHSLCMIFHFC